ncbi:MAG: membrane dipeptidase [Anaerolineae bacterium]|jgi:membrane dipeptidase|nr:membrane dipeptidase [Anaerolineae bacterium]
MAETTKTSPRYPIVDAHIDLAYGAVVLGRDLSLSVDALRDHERRHEPLDPKAGVCTVTLPALREGRVAVIGGSIFVEPGKRSHPRPTATYHTSEQANAQAVQQLDYYRRISDDSDSVEIVSNAAALDRVLARWGTDDASLGIFVVMEGAEPILDPGDLGWWVERGLRGIGLSWSAGTRYAGGNASPGLITDEGQSLLRAMADSNLLLDISHLWEEAAHTVLDRYPGPIVATHANPRAFVDSPRMLSDDLIRRVVEREGVIGVVACNPMLEPGWKVGQARVPLTRMIEAVDHICQIAGHAEAAGLGTDLDGGFGLASIPAELGSAADLSKIERLLRERGYSEGDVQAIMGANWLRMMRQALEAF